VSRPGSCWRLWTACPHWPASPASCGRGSSSPRTSPCTPRLWPPTRPPAPGRPPLGRPRAQQRHPPRRRPGPGVLRRQPPAPSCPPLQGRRRPPPVHRQGTLPCRHGGCTRPAAAATDRRRARARRRGRPLGRRPTRWLARPPASLGCVRSRYAREPLACPAEMWGRRSPSSWCACGHTVFECFVRSFPAQSRRTRGSVTPVWSVGLTFVPCVTVRVACCVVAGFGWQATRCAKTWRVGGGGVAALH
jgi:hypothetical protein